MEHLCLKWRWLSGTSPISFNKFLNENSCCVFYFSSGHSDEAMDVEEWKRMRSGSCICQDHLDQSPACPAHKRQSVSNFSLLLTLVQNIKVEGGIADLIPANRTRSKKSLCPVVTVR